ncbi:hypothetical protein [Methylobacterium sp. Leaf108]|uniref:hypothetical protein n=1 Tax=Methylobacterium sp. Leaf108 TaxID=1736256 RepID=UPI0006F967E5|nr:hypothetical protein [Methylobacterium sp. Leaf108]KQP61057.1 hypothetical protein ASF39_15385 [Methylobacterium sp. Leaf108]
MADTSAPASSLDMAEQVARVMRSLEETQKFVAEQKKLIAEAAKLERDRSLAPWQLFTAGGAAAAAFFGAGAAFVKLLGP